LCWGLATCPPPRAIALEAADKTMTLARVREAIPIIRVMALS
jgi:hypothetical protein